MWATQPLCWPVWRRIAALAARHGMKTLLRPGLALYGLIPQYAPAFEQRSRVCCPPALNSSRCCNGRAASWASARFPPEPWLAITAALSPPSRCSWRWWPRVTPTASTARLGNRFYLLVRGERAPLVGRISMDQAVVDVTGIPGVQAGDEVVILGAQGSESITALDHAEAAATIPWEVFTRIGQRVQRVAV